MQTAINEPKRWLTTLAPWITGLWLCAWLIAGLQLCCPPAKAVSSPCHQAVSQVVGVFSEQAVASFHAAEWRLGPGFPPCLVSAHAFLDQGGMKESLPQATPEAPIFVGSGPPLLPLPRGDAIGPLPRGPPPILAKRPIYLATARLRL
jgi:hypothetical protein